MARLLPTLVGGKFARSMAGASKRSSLHMWGLGAGAAAGPALRGQSQRVREDADLVQGRK